MNTVELMNWAIELYEDIASYAVPIAFAFGMGNLIISTFLRVAFGGRLVFRGGDK